MLNILAAGIHLVYESGAWARSGQKHRFRNHLIGSIGNHGQAWGYLKWMCKMWKGSKSKTLKKIYIQGMDKGRQAYKTAD